MQPCPYHPTPVIPAVILLVLQAACQVTGDPSGIEPAIPVTDLPGFQGERIFRDGDLYFGGQPSAAALREIARRGIRTVVNLRSENEVHSLDFDEASLARELQLEYIALPVTPASFSRSDVDRFTDIISTRKRPVLIHCSSSNRVGGMWAAYLAKAQEMAMPDALRLGKAAGLSKPGMREAVVRVIEGSSPPGGSSQLPGANPHGHAANERQAAPTTVPHSGNGGAGGGPPERVKPRR